MPDHIGRITLKGDAAKELLKSVGNTMSASISGKVESASIEEDFSDSPSKPGQERKKVPHVHIDITGISNINNPAHRSLKKVMGEE